MFLYADRTVCPRCRAALPTLASGCDQCRAALDDAHAYDVFVALQQVDRLVAQLADRPLVAATTPTPTHAAGPAPTPAPTRAHVPTPRPAGGLRAPFPVEQPHPARPVLSGLTVPKILLGLGALCLVVAALVFLAVAWAALGVGGRTAVLLAFTATAGGLAAWCARTGLRAGAEALTTVALGLLLLDLAGAHSAGWFGDLGLTGFAVLAGTAVAGAATVAAVATRRTREPRLVSAEIVAALGAVAALVATAGFDWATPARWALAVTLAGSAVALGFRSLALTVPSLGVGTVAGLGWLGLAGLGLTRAATHASWHGLWADGHVWPLLAATALAAAPLAVRRLPVQIRVGAASVAALLATVALGMPGLDEAPTTATLTLAAVVAAHTAIAWSLRRPWLVVAAAPLALAGGTTALLAGLAALQAVLDSNLLDHGLWTEQASSPVAPWSLDGVWSVLLPLTTAAALAAALGLVRIAGTPTRPLMAPAITVLVTAGALAPTVAGLPRVAVVGVLALAAAGLAAWALRHRPATPWLGSGLLTALALGAALADDGLTITVLTVLTLTLAASESRTAPAWLRIVAAWSLPLVLGSAVWATVSALDLATGWRAVPVIAAVAVLALLRPRAEHEASALATALVAITASAAVVPADLRLVAAQLTATALVATVVGLLRRPEASLTGMALLGAAGLAAWPDTVTATVVLAIGVAVTLLHEVRRTDPATAVLARVATPVATGALLWSAGDLAGLGTAWLGVPVMVVLGALVVTQPDPAREIPAGLVAAWCALTACASLGDPQAWAAVYLTLGGVVLTLSALLHTERRHLAWGGLALLTLATWLRLDQLGVGTVEAYTLPLALVLLVVGSVALLRGDRSSLQTQGAGLGLALVPSLVQVLAEPVVLRAALLGVGCVVLMTIGVQRRWAAPLLAGGATLALLVLRQMTIAQVLPQWVLIGLAGVVLTFVGLTWEKRLANVRTAADYLRGLR